MKHRRLAIALLGVAAGLTWKAPGASAQVAIYGQWNNNPYWNYWVKQGIESVGLPLGNVTAKFICCGMHAPTVAELQQYRAVLVFAYGNPYVNGDNFHDYVDSGGGVVIATPLNATYGFGGRWASQQYDPIKLAGLFAGTHEWLGTIHQPTHPLFTVTPVVSFDGGSASYHPSGALGYNSVVLAEWTDGAILAAERLGLAGRVLGLGFLPYSNQYAPENWIEGTDGYNLLANALYYAGRFDQCAVPETYCTGKVNSLGCTPSIQWAGAPTAAAANVFTIQGSTVLSATPGLLLYGINGRASVPYQSGFLCVSAPIRRTIGVWSGGTPTPINCTGSFALDMNAFARGGLGGNPSPALRTPGTIVDCQWWGRDPGYAPANDAQLTNALEYTVCP